MMHYFSIKVRLLLRMNRYWEFDNDFMIIKMLVRWKIELKSELIITTILKNEEKILSCFCINKCR